MTNFHLQPKEYPMQTNQHPSCSSFSYQHTQHREITYNKTNTQTQSNLFLVFSYYRHLRLGLTWYDVAHLYEGHTEARAGYYLKSRNNVVKLVSCLPKSNKGMKDDYLILSGPWSDGLACPTKAGTPGGAL